MKKENNFAKKNMKLDRVAMGMALTLTVTSIPGVNVVLEKPVVVSADENSAYDFKYDGYRYNCKIIDATNKYVSIVYYGGNDSGTLTIPSTVTDNGVTYTVTEIGILAFGTGSSGDDAGIKLTKIIIPETVTAIDESAFANLPTIKEINIPGSVKRISSDAFSGCRGLTKVTIGEGVEEIGSMAFGDCTSLASINLPSTIKTIENSAFSGMTSLASITIPSKVTTITNSLFKGDIGLKTVNLPDNLTTIESYAFDSTGLTSVTLPSKVTQIGSGAFSGCASLESATIKGTATDIPSNLFLECENLTSVSFAGNISTIGAGAFKNCAKLSSLTLGTKNMMSGNFEFPNTLTSIGSSAFNGCNSINTIVMPSSITDMSKIGKDAFSRMSGLTKVTIGSGVKAVPGEKFEYNSKLSTIIIPSGVTSIADYAFYDCTAVKNLTLPKSLTSISEYAFTEDESVITLSAINYEGTATQYNTLKTNSASFPWLKNTSITPTYNYDMSNIGGGDTTVAVTGVTLNKTELTLTEGETSTLAPTIAPTNATNKSVSWTSSKPEVATVDAEGKVTAVAAGDAIITVTTADEEKTATCAVTVTAKTTEIENFVDRLYTNLLKQSVNATEKASFVKSLSTNETTAAQVVADFALNGSIAEISNEDFVSRMYSAVFNRNADEGKKHYENLLNNGMSRKIVIQKFTESQEFANICASCGMPQGKFQSEENRDSNIDVTSFVNNLYLTILGRTPDILEETPNLSGINCFTGTLLKHASTDGIIKEFILGAEYTSKNYTNEEFIIACFRGILGRTETTIDKIDGGKLFLDTLNAKIKTREGIVGSPLDSEEINKLREEIVDSLLDSEEYENRLYKYGLNK